MLESTRKEGKGEDLENAFPNLAQCLQNKPLYFADLLYDSMKGKGTCDKVLIRILVSKKKKKKGILVSCSEVDMLKIRSEFKRKYGKSLYYYIQVSPMVTCQPCLAIQKALDPQAGGLSEWCPKWWFSNSLGKRC